MIPNDRRVPSRPHRVGDPVATALLAAACIAATGSVVVAIFPHLLRFLHG